MTKITQEDIDAAVKEETPLKVLANGIVTRDRKMRQEAECEAKEKGYTPNELLHFFCDVGQIKERDRLMALAKRVVNSPDPEKEREAEIAYWGYCHELEMLQKFVAMTPEELLEYVRRVNALIGDEIIKYYEYCKMHGLSPHGNQPSTS